MNGEPKYAERSKELIKVIRNLGSTRGRAAPQKRKGAETGKRRKKKLKCTHFG